MKRLFLLVILVNSFLLSSSAQSVAIANDKVNIFYARIDNPVSIAVNGISEKSIIVKATFGKIRKEYGIYVFSAESAGETQIEVYEKMKTGLKLLGTKQFRVKRIPAPTLKIGSGKDRMPIPEIRSQQYVRADFDGYFGYDIKFTIESFTICIISADPCRYTQLNNTGNKINDEIIKELMLLKPDDILVFKNIICSGPDGKIELNPKMVMAY